MPPKKGYLVSYLDDSLSLAVIHSFSKYLLSTYYVLSRAGDSMGNKMHSCSPRAHRLKGGTGRQVVPEQGLCEHREGG